MTLSSYTWVRMTLIAHTRDWHWLGTRVLKLTQLEKITVDPTGSEYKTLTRIVGFTIFPPYKNFVLEILTQGGSAELLPGS